MVKWCANVANWIFSVLPKIYFSFYPKIWHSLDFGGAIYYPNIRFHEFFTLSGRILLYSSLVHIFLMYTKVCSIYIVHIIYSQKILSQNINSIWALYAMPYASWYLSAYINVRVCVSAFALSCTVLWVLEIKQHNVSTLSSLWMSFWCCWLNSLNVNGR